MRIVDMAEAGADLPRLVAALESGAEAEIVLARDGRPAARLVPVADEPAKPARLLGIAEGRYPSMSLEEFNASDAEIAKLFLGEE